MQATTEPVKKYKLSVDAIRYLASILDVEAINITLYYKLRRAYFSFWRIPFVCSSIVKLTSSEVQLLKETIELRLSDKRYVSISDREVLSSAWKALSQ